MPEDEIKSNCCLSQTEVDQFNSEGYLIFDGFFDKNLNQLLKEDVDQLMTNRANKGETNLIVFPSL